MKKILVTGANGFVGSHLCEMFNNENYNIIGTDFEKRFSNDKYEFIESDLLNDDIESLLSHINPDIIIHCAGSADVHKSVLNPLFDFNGNVVILHRLLFAMKKLNMENCRFVFLSSAGVYGQPKQLPITEESPLNPLSPYALHKKICEDICQYFVENYNFNIKIVRIFSTYGPGLRKQIFWDMNEKIKNTGFLKMFGSGNESRDYIYITDLINAIYLIAVDDKEKHNIYNVGNAEEVYIKDIAKMFAKEKGLSQDRIIFDGYVREGDPINWRADISRLEKLGYKKAVNIENGIKFYVDWINSLED